GVPLTLVRWLDARSQGPDNRPMTGFGSCPRCRLPLSAARAGTRQVHGCVHCGGVWLDPALAQQVAHALEPELRTMAEIAAQYARAAVDTALPAHCPQCHSVPHRLSVTRARLELDACGARGARAPRRD